jgi:nucleoside-diphosphate-sugar epimerase
MQIAITGATGLIGRRLVHYFNNKGAIIHVLSRGAFQNTNSRIRVFNFDLASCSTENLASFTNGCDILYHCAAELSDENKMVQVNVDGTKKLFHAAKGQIGRWVQLSSVGVYGRPRFGMIHESQSSDPKNAYERSKLVADEWLTNESAKTSMALTIVRPSTVFANDMPNQSIFQLARRIQRGQFMYIGSRNAQMNYVHADNVIAALVLCGYHPQAVGQTYIVSDHLAINEFVDVLVDQLKCRRPWLVIPEAAARGLTALFGGIPSFPLTSSRIDALTNRCIYSDQHIKKQLGFISQTTLEVGLRQLADYLLALDCQPAGSPRD